nr:transmembrane 9 superfamily member 1 [Tanacetum cinerariifolium]
EHVDLWVNKVRPYNNPQETFNYYILPFCHSSGHTGYKWGGLDEVLGRNELIDSQIDVKFQRLLPPGTQFDLFRGTTAMKQDVDDKYPTTLGHTIKKNHPESARFSPDGQFLKHKQSAQRDEVQHIESEAISERRRDLWV